MGTVVDVIATADSVEAGLADYKAPINPCPMCGKESLPHHPVLGEDGEVEQERRICSSKTCREIHNA